VNGSPVGPLVLLLIVIATDAWVYVDARSRRDSGQDVVASVGPIAFSAPEHWLLGCIVLWIVVLPMYLVARRP